MAKGPVMHRYKTKIDLVFIFFSLKTSRYFLVYQCTTYHLIIITVYYILVVFIIHVVHWYTCGSTTETFIVSLHVLVKYNLRALPAQLRDACVLQRPIVEKLND